jgi:hypothetical protein
MWANYAVLLCAKACDLVAARVKFVEENAVNGCNGEVFAQSWLFLWNVLQRWLADRPPQLLPADTASRELPRSHSSSATPSTISAPSVASTSATRSHPRPLFPEIFYAFPAAISSNQLYHTACILLLEIKPFNITLEPTQISSQVWHARRICGISLTNPHRGCLNNAIQPLWVAGKLLSHRSEHVAVVRLIEEIEGLTGWGMRWRIRDLREVWGYEVEDVL